MDIRANEAEFLLPTSWNSVKDRPSRVSGQGKVTGSSSRTEQPCQDGGVAPPPRDASEREFAFPAAPEEEPSGRMS